MDGQPIRVAVERHGDEWIVLRGKREHRLGLTIAEPGVVLVHAGGRTHVVHTAAAGARRALHVDGCTLEYEVGRDDGTPDAGTRTAGARAAERDLTAPMPGAVTRVLVREGDQVRMGQPLVIIEAMKMEHVVRATAPGTVRSLRVRPGDQVDGGAVVAEIGPA